MREGVAISTIMLDNFGPGIMADYHGASGQSDNETTGYVNGGATIANTFRCCSDPSGALVPLPKLTLVRTHDLLPAGNTDIGSTFYPAERVAAFLMDASIFGPPDFVFSMYQYYWSDQHNSNYNWYVQGLINTPFSGPEYHWLFSRIDAPDSGPAVHRYQLYSGGLDQNRTIIVTDDTASANFSNLAPIVVAGYSGFDYFNDDATLTAAELAVTTFDTDLHYVGYTRPGASGEYVLTCYPRPTGTRTPDRQDVFSSLTFEGEAIPVPTWPYVTMLCSHQGRVLGAAHWTVTVAGQVVTVSKDLLFYFPAIDFMATAAADTWSQRTATTLDIGEESISPIGILASISADELLVIKHRNGGYLIRGDIDNPTIQRLPFIESTAGIASYPTLTPIGLVYGTANGVFSFTGGEQSEKISGQLEGWFWDHRDDIIPADAVINEGTGGIVQTYPEEYTGIVGRFGYLHPWVAVPNNFLYDTRSKGWWRIEMPDPVNGPVAFNVYAATTNNNLRCFPYKLTATRNEQYYDLDPSVLASSYSWQSQPLFQSRDRLLTVKEMELVVTVPADATTPRVKVTLTGYREDGSAIPPVVTLFNVPPNANPQQHVKVVSPNFTAMHIQVRIEAQDNRTAPAPKVHSLKITIDDRSEPAKS